MNLDLWQLRRRKGVPERRSPLDFMGKTELAANLFRVTQTEEKIRAERIRGQRPLEQAAEDAGRLVRRTMVEISGRRPEELPPAPTKTRESSEIRPVPLRFTVATPF